MNWTEGAPGAVKEAGGDLRLDLSGRLDASRAGELWSEAIERVELARPARLVVAADGLGYCDGSGAALLWELRARQEARGAAFELEGLSPALERVVELHRPRGGSAPRRRPVGAVEQVGHATLALLADLRELVAFVGTLLFSLGHAVRHPRRVRWREALGVAEAAGVDALPIVATVGFLMGLIMAFNSAIPMKTFGVEIFVADLVAIAMLRELGPLMTAIVLAGRSGSAFAAELGTMRVNEELDALSTMGVDPVRFLVVPRVLAALVVTPLLAVFANLCGLVGGLVVFLSFGYPVVTYRNQVVGAVDAGDLCTGLAKAFAFGLLVAAVGCVRGLGTGRGATAVGRSTTRAVVTSIVLIAVVDGLFSVVYYALGI